MSPQHRRVYVFQDQFSPKKEPQISITPSTNLCNPERGGASDAMLILRFNAYLLYESSVQEFCLMMSILALNACNTGYVMPRLGRFKVIFTAGHMSYFCGSMMREHV
jgi:hypothetical protein